MVAMVEGVTLVLLALLGFLWLRRTTIYRARRRHGTSPGQYGNRATFGMYQTSQPPQRPAALHDFHRPSRHERRQPTDDEA